MINLFDKSRTPFFNNKILTKSFLINNIANEMKIKYKKVFSLINYDEHSLKTNIDNLLSKYISNRHKEINIKYIETTILNKVRQKYKVLKTPINSIKRNNNKRLVKIIYSYPNQFNSYLNLNKKIKVNSAAKNKKYLSPIKKNEINEKRKEKNDQNQEKEKSNEINNEIYKENVNENNKINEIEYNVDELKKNIIKEEEIKTLEKYNEDIQNKIDEISKDLENEEKIKNLKKQLTNNNKENEKNGINSNKYNNYIITNNIDLKDDLDWKYNPSINLEQIKYLERKKRIEEDFYNNQNRYIFLKPIHNINEEENSKINKNNLYKYGNIKINKYSMDKINEYNIIKEKIRKEKEFKNRSAKNIYDIKEFKEEKNTNKKNKILINIPFEDKIQMKILQRSLDQERAIEHLRNILYPQKQILEESEYQGFNNSMSIKNIMKKREYELADEARKIQIEKMKKLLDESICDRRKRKNEEIDLEKKYREMLEKNYELYLEKERKYKFEKAEKIENYRKLLDEQIDAKKQIILDEDNFLEINNLALEE